MRYERPLFSITETVTINTDFSFSIRLLLAITGMRVRIQYNTHLKIKFW